MSKQFSDEMKRKAIELLRGTASYQDSLDRLTAAGIDEKDAKLLIFLIANVPNLEDEDDTENGSGK